jgi:hypothetical protein
MSVGLCSKRQGSGSFADSLRGKDGVITREGSSSNGGWYEVMVWSALFVCFLRASCLILFFFFFFFSWTILSTPNNLSLIYVAVP